MEAVVRHLRDGRIREQAGPCPTALLCDDLGCAGGRDLIQQLVSDYLAAFAKGLCQAGGVKLLMLEGSVCLDEQQPSITVLDGFSDPAGWIRAAGTASSAGLANSVQLISSAEPGSLPAMLEALVAAGPGQGVTAITPAAATGSSEGRGGTCVIIDNLSALFLHHPAAKVLSFLEQLRNHAQVSCVITAAHQDVVGDQALTGLQRQASCVMRLQPVGGLQRDLLKQLTGQAAHGYLSCAFKSRKAGRLRTEGSFYTLDTATGVSFIHAPAQLAELTPEALVALSLRQAAAASPGPKALDAPSTAPAAGSALRAGPVQVALQPQGVPAVEAAGAAVAGGPVAAAAAGRAGGLPMEQAGGMRLTLTEEERQAKQAVVLPYEHRGAGQAYQTGDWKDYLPAAAGGRSGPQHGQPGPGVVAAEPGKLGHILYVRDSDDEQGGLHDSDEDPDDDLDI